MVKARPEKAPVDVLGSHTGPVGQPLQLSAKLSALHTLTADCDDCLKCTFLRRRSALLAFAGNVAGSRQLADATQKSCGPSGFWKHV